MPTDQELIKIVPSSRQLAYQATEFYAFFHFGMNTYTNREWGDGTETPQIFNPTEFVADQWVSAALNAGMKGVILTCKQHDGFCLWPTRYSSHSVVSSPWKNGRVDDVWQVSEACRRYGMKFGIYLSPWDRNKPCYGSGKEYDDYYLAQLTELLTGDGIWAELMRLLYRIDEADNLFPSIHCLVSWICYIGIRGNKKVPLAFRVFSCIMALAVCISTLTTKQHVIYDVVAGIALAEAGYFILGRIGRQKTGGGAQPEITIEKEKVIK